MPSIVMYCIGNNIYFMEKTALGAFLSHQNGMFSILPVFFNKRSCDTERTSKQSAAESFVSPFAFLGSRRTIQGAILSQPNFILFNKTSRNLFV